MLPLSAVQDPQREFFSELLLEKESKNVWLTYKNEQWVWAE